MIHKNWDSLEKDVIDKVRYVVQDAQLQSYIRLDDYMKRFYTVPQGKEYKRTGHLGNSANLGYFTPITNGASATISVDTSPFYTTGTYSTPKVFEEAEIHGSGILGVPHFWMDTMTDIENEIIPMTFGRYFRKV